MLARLINSHSTRLPGRADRRSIARLPAVRLPHLARTVASEHRLRPNLATSDPRFVEPLQRDLFETDFARSQEWAEAQPVRWNDYIADRL